MTFYSDKEWREQEGIKRLFRLWDAQEKETTKTMLKFEQNKYVLRIIDDSYGFLTVKIGQRPTGIELYTVKFLKKRPKGVVYNFHKADRLERLYIEENILHDLRMAATKEKDNG